MPITLDRPAPKKILSKLIQADKVDVTALDAEAREAHQAKCENLRRLLPEALLEAIETTPKKDLMPGFYFEFPDMEQLLKAYYHGAKRGWLSHLHKQDMSAQRIGHCRAILYDPAKIPSANRLFQFSHRQVDKAIRTLALRSTVRDGRSITGWLEYCLRVLAKKTNPKHEENATMPEVRTEDQERAMIVLSQILAPSLGQIDRKQVDEQLDQLFNQLKK